MTKKTLSPEDSALFRQSIGKVNPLKSDTILFSSENKPKPYPQKQTVQTKDSFDNSVQTDTEKLYQEDSLSFLAPGL